MKTITRQEYMADSSSLHRAYHAQFVNTRIIRLVESRIGVDAIKHSTDPHLNDIRLAKWDALTLWNGTNPGTDLGLTKKAVALGEGWVTQAFLVSVLKEAARQIKDKNK